MAFSFAPQVATQRNKAVAAEARVGIERSTLLPQVYLRHEKYSGEGMRNVGDQTFIAVEYQFGSGVSSAYAWSAAINQQRGAEAAIQASEKDLTSTLTREWNQYHLSSSQLKIVKIQAENSVEVRESFLRQYTIGKRTWLEVLNAQREMTQTQFTLADTEANFLRSQYKLALLTGLLQVSDLSLIKK
jgi:adhesin transport system outer membrane protein